MTSVYSNSQPEVNGGREFSEMKVQKARVLMFVIY